MAAALQDSTFKNEIEEYKGTVLVDFWAAWCGPCRMLEPSIEELAEKYSASEDVKIMKLNVDENPATAQKFGVMGIPTMIIFKDGQPIEQLVGVRPMPQIQDAVEKVRNS